MFDFDERLYEGGRVFSSICCLNTHPISTLTASLMLDGSSVYYVWVYAGVIPRHSMPRTS